MWLLVSGFDQVGLNMWRLKIMRSPRSCATTPCALSPSASVYSLRAQSLRMPDMERSGPEIPGSTHGEHEPTGQSTEMFSRTEQRQKQSTCHQYPSSQQSQLFDRSTEMSAAKGVGQTPEKCDSGDKPHLDSAINRTSGRTSGEVSGGSQAGRAIQHDSEMSQGQEQEPESIDESGLIDSNDPGWCSNCLKIEEWMIRGKGYTEFCVGTREDLEASVGCSSCDDILKMFSGGKRIRGSDKIFFNRNDDVEGRIPYSYSLDTDAEGSFYAFLNPLDQPSHLMVMGSMVDLNWFDIARLQRWLTFCDENHGGECHSLPIRHESVSTRPRYLIDVAQGCLVESRGDERYFALSYVWGAQQDAGMATKENIDSLKQEGAITVRNATFRLPRTVEDAIQLTELLGERFLWIDRLCIIQDDLANWHSQIKKMGSIYANAYCTFVASGGSDADHGIPGLSQHSGPRQLLQRHIKFSSLQMIQIHHSNPTDTSTWIKRGWTFQELQLSRRAIFFNNDVRWICHQSEWEEEVLAEPEGISSKIPSCRGHDLVPLSVEPWPDFSQWWHLMCSYSPRCFQFESDAGAAFAGIEEILGRSFPGGFCFGMPEFYFDIALLWWPQDPQQRRSPRSHGSSYLPSWSFLGWKGGRITGNRPFACEWLTILETEYGPRSCSPSSIVPKVNWIQKGPCGQERRIRNDYHIWKRSQDQQSPEAQANLGWRKEGIGDAWVHASIPNVVFRYPVPFGFQTVTDEYHTKPGSLWLRSQSTSFIISNKIYTPCSLISTCFWTELVTHAGKWAGMLHLNTNETREVPNGAKCELVALSCGSVSNKDEHAQIWIEEWNLDDRPRESEKYEFYNVMWIKREGTYVVRENIGRVEKSVWDCQELQEIDVELR